jgi:porphobilinogen synthase
MEPLRIRPRRLRGSPALRALVRETRLAAADLVWPLFVAEGLAGRQEIGAMPGQFRHGLDSLLSACEEAVAAGVRSVILFGIPKAKDALGSQAWSDDGVVQRAVRSLKERGFPLVVMTDACLCEYTDHGHCGLVREGRIENDPTLPLLARAAVSHAEAGADVVAPSDMMDGRVAALREALDEAGHSETPILSYAVKYASAYYGPFREAAGSTPAFGDRRTHQMDPANRREALREALLDVAEGADAVMVKPALPYLDVLREVRDAVDVPVAAYHVSGEYAMIEAAGARGWIDRDAVVLETLTAIRRAGADFVLTYHAVDAARLLKKGDGPLF